MKYPGGKHKTYQHIINLIPPHKVYIEPFLGGAAVMRMKAPSDLSYGIDKDAHAFSLISPKDDSVQLIEGDGFTFLEKYPFTGNEVVYCDPPYYPSTRVRDRVYKYDLSHSEHKKLLNLLKQIDAYVLLSGYTNELYEAELADWNIKTFQAKTHTGMRTEYLWFNFPIPNELHDYRYLGSDFRERQTIKRRLNRFTKKLNQMSEIERSYIREWLNDKEGTHAS